MRQIIVVLIAVVFLIAAVLISGSLSERAEQPRKKGKISTTKLVETLKAENTKVQTKVALYGRLVAFQKTDLYSEVAGMLLNSSKPFRAGTRFRKGDVLLRLDAEEQNLNIQAQRSALLTSITQMMPDMKIDFSESLQQWQDYRLNFEMEKTTPPLPVPKSDREKNYVTLKNIYNQYYTIKSQEERLAKYIIYAPFSGEITASFINTGSFVRAGQQIGTLMNTGVYELEASIPLRDMQYVKIGDKVVLQSEDIKGTWDGRISRIGNSIETKTQTVKLYIKVNGRDLRENMFLSGEIEANRVADVIEVPRKLLVDDNKLFLVQDSILKLQPIQIVKLSESTALVRGLEDGTQLLKENFPGAFDGMKVAVLE